LHIPIIANIFPKIDILQKILLENIKQQSLLSVILIKDKLTAWNLPPK